MSRREIDQRSPTADEHCNHPLAVLVEPSERELSKLEEMLARCPVCSRWSPGDGPIMAVVPRVKNRKGGPEELV